MNVVVFANLNLRLSEIDKYFYNESMAMAMAMKAAKRDANSPKYIYERSVRCGREEANKSKEHQRPENNKLKRKHANGME